MMTEKEAHEEVPCPGPGCTSRTGSARRGCTICAGDGTIERWVWASLIAGEVLL